MDIELELAERKAKALEHDRKLLVEHEKEVQKSLIIANKDKDWDGWRLVYDTRKEQYGKLRTTVLIAEGRGNDSVFLYNITTSSGYNNVESKIIILEKEFKKDIIDALTESFDKMG